MAWWKLRHAVPTPRLEHLLFTFYTRQGCHLCEDALTRLKQAQKRHAFQIQVVDIDGEPELVARYGQWVPVVTLAGKVRFKGVINRVLLDRLLAGEERRLPPSPS